MLSVALPETVATIGDQAVIRKIGADDFSTVRYVHAGAFKALAAPLLSDDEIKAFLDHVYSPGYVDALMQTNVYVAVLNGQLVGTAAWGAGDDSGAAARIGSVFVDPMFTQGGIGRRLVTEVEMRAAEAGYTRFSVRSTSNAVPFFLSIGYDIASHGVSSLSVADGALPVTFMRKHVADKSGRPRAA
jgi:GNAT superfamily N-acetyltransferase